jgi:hypothetical protein
MFFMGAVCRKMGAFVYLFGGIARKRYGGQELILEKQASTKVTKNTNKTKWLGCRTMQPLVVFRAFRVFRAMF